MYRSLSYSRYDFRVKKIDDGKLFYIRVQGKYVLVPEDVFRVCYNDYARSKYALKREAEHSMRYYADVDEIASFFCCPDMVDDIYKRDLVALVLKGIDELPEKLRNVAICIFVKEMSVKETSLFLHLPTSTVSDRKKVIMRNLQEIVKKSG